MSRIQVAGLEVLWNQNVPPKRIVTIQKFNSSPLKTNLPNRKVEVFQPWLLRGELLIFIGGVHKRFSYCEIQTTFSHTMKSSFNTLTCRVHGQGIEGDEATAVH